MRLTQVRITEFQSIRDSLPFQVGDITCLVGKNEAGKTAVLQALYRLNPIIAQDRLYVVTDDYPRRDVEDYRIAVEAEEQKPAIVATCTFDLDDDDIEAVEQVFGPKCIKTSNLVLKKGYSGTTYFILPVDTAAAFRHLATPRDLPGELKAALKANDADVKALLQSLSAVEQKPAVKQLRELLTKINEHGGVASYIYQELIARRVPKFLYFDEYYQMKGRANIEALRERIRTKALEPSDHPLLGLINLSRLNIDQLLNPKRTRDLKNSLEGAGNHLTKRVIKYWSQNKHLQLHFDVRPAHPEDPEGMRGGTNIWADVLDTKHRVTTELGTRSRGFVWFFSFLAWYADIQRQGEKVILLLDEPGLSLHGRAQEDLLRYFDTEIQGAHQLIYTTHSPFMVDPKYFDRVRIVQDRSIESDEEIPSKDEGTKVLTDVLEATEDSLFPLQGALGYEIYQTLFIGPNSLVVEGVSDLLYLQTMSALLEGKGKTGLSSGWTITPVGGSEKVPTFVALVGAQRKLNVAVLVDIQKKDRQRIENLYKRKLLEKENVLTFADFVGESEADIEDMFDVDFYLELVNGELASSLAKPVSKAALPQTSPRLVARLEEYFAAHPLKNNLQFNHYRPARYLSERISALQKDVSDATIERFEALFKRLNALL